MDKTKVETLLKDAYIPHVVDLSEEDFYFFSKEAKKIGVSTEDFVSAILAENIKKTIKEERKKLTWLYLFIGSIIYSLCIPLLLLIFNFILKETKILPYSFLIISNTIGWMLITLYSFYKITKDDPTRKKGK